MGYHQALHAQHIRASVPVWSSSSTGCKLVAPPISPLHCRIVQEEICLLWHRNSWGSQTFWCLFRWGGKEAGDWAKRWHAHFEATKESRNQLKVRNASCTESLRNETLSIPKLRRPCHGPLGGQIAAVLHMYSVQDASTTHARGIVEMP